jgi:hypothetical protein
MRSRGNALEAIENTEDIDGIFPLLAEFSTFFPNLSSGLQFASEHAQNATQRHEDFAA